MSYSIAFLLDLGISPNSPDVWTLLEDRKEAVVLDRKDPVDREVNFSRAQGILEAKVWATTSPHEANGGLLSGAPNLEPT